MIARINWRISKPGEDFIERSTTQMFRQQAGQPALLLNHDNEYLHYQDDWYGPLWSLHPPVAGGTPGAPLVSGCCSTVLPRRPHLRSCTVRLTDGHSRTVPEHPDGCSRRGALSLGAPAHAPHAPLPLCA
jgi:hypothetical protein